MQKRFSSVFNRMRYWHGFLQVVVFALLVQAFVPAGMALAADVHGDTEFGTVICRTLSNLDDQGQLGGVDPGDCSMCVALDMGKAFVPEAAAVHLVIALQIDSAFPLPVHTPTSAEIGTSQQVRAPPLS